jgi:hypothetical protein
MPANKQPEPEPEPTPSPAEPDEPQWAKNLRTAIESLPAKMRATVTDDDRRSIAEQVHGLFERSGAFEKRDDKPGGTEEPVDDGKDERPQKRESWASRVFGQD